MLFRSTFRASLSAFSTSPGVVIVSGRKAPLRAVGDSEAAPAPSKKTVAQAAESGTHLELLIAMRDRIARAVSSPDCPPRDLAALTRRLQDVAAEIKALKDAEDADADRDQDEGGDAFDASAI